MAPPEPPERGGTIATDALIGHLVAGKYRVASLVARGGMGRVYRAVQEPLGRVVALKVLTPSFLTAEEPAALERRFLREAATCARLTHPNTVTVFDYGALSLAGQDTLFIVMEFVEGRTLHEAIKADGPFPAARALRIAREIGRSLKEAHEQGVVHRDLKPSNVILVERDDGESVKVLDFGVAKVVQAETDHVTHDGSFVGSPRYSAPEQIRGEEVDARADIYALGVVMYEMLCGAPPFARQEAMRTLVAHLQDPVPPLAARCKLGLPAGAESIVMRCLEKDRNLRPDDVGALLALLRPLLDGDELPELDLEDTADPLPVVAPPPSPPRPTRSRGLVFAALGSVGMLLVLSLAALGWWGSRPAPVPQVAPPATAPAPAPLRVVVNSTPAGAQVREGDTVLGVTPLPIDVLPGSPRRLRLTLEGHRPADVVADGSAPVELTLSPIPAEPRPKPKPREPDIRTER